MSVCLIFVFASLLEFAVVNVFSRKEIRQTRRNSFRHKRPNLNHNRDEEIALEQVRGPVGVGGGVGWGCRVGWGGSAGWGGVGWGCRVG